MCNGGDSTCGLPDAEAIPAPEGRAPSIAEQLEELRCGIASALGLSPAPSDEVLLKAVGERMVKLDILREERKAIKDELGLVEVMWGALPDCVHKRLATRPTEGEVNALKASLEEARAAEAKMREAWEHHRGLAEKLITERDEARAAEAHWRERAAEVAQIVRWRTLERIEVLTALGVGEAEPGALGEAAKRLLAEQRQRAEKAEAACRSLDAQNKAEVANAEVMRERADKAQAEVQDCLAQLRLALSSQPLSLAEAVEKVRHLLAERREVERALGFGSVQEYFLGRMVLEEREKWEKERAELLAKVAGHEAIMATARPLAPVLEAHDARLSDAHSALARCEVERDAWARKAGEVERHFEASRRDAEALRVLLRDAQTERDMALASVETSRAETSSQRALTATAERELATLKARGELAEELGTSHAQSHENARRQIAGLHRRVADLRRQLANMTSARDHFRAQTMQAQANAQLEEAMVERERARAVSEELRRQLDDLRADRTSADALRKRLAAAHEAVRKLKTTIVMMAVERVELLTSMGVTREKAAQHVCNVWKPTSGGKPSDPWVCESCGKPFEDAVFAPQPQPPPEELQCHGSGAPLGPPDGFGRHCCKECDYRVSAGPTPRSHMPNHPPRWEDKEAANEARIRREGVR